MRNNKGITLTSLIIYVIGMTVIISLIATLTSFFYKNVNVEELTNDTSTQYTKFSSVFAEEVNKENNYIVDCNTSYIIFSSGNQYTYKSENKSIYKNTIKICQNIDECEFSYTVIDGKFNIKVEFKAGNIDFTGDNAITFNT